MEDLFCQNTKKSTLHPSSLKYPHWQVRKDENGYKVPYRTKIRRSKVSKFQLGIENFVRRKFCPVFQYKSQAKIGQNCQNFGLVSKKFVRRKILFIENFVRQNKLLIRYLPYCFYKHD